jgi:lipopolysaccharide heptosyltransferase II
MSANPLNNLERILAIRLDNIGDIIMLSPALRALRRAYPAAHITLMASPAGTQVVPLLPWVDDVITWRAVWQNIAKDVPAEPEKEHALVAELEKHQFDAAFIFTSFSQSPYPPAYACYLAQIPQRIGQSREFGGGLLTHWVKPLSDSSYQVERNLHLLRSIGIPVEDARMELQTSVEEQYIISALLSEYGISAGTPFLALAPGASAAARRYDEQRFEQSARQLQQETQLPIVLLGSQREVGQFPMLEKLAVEHPDVHSLMGRTSVPGMAEIIRRAALVICNNSSALHMAEAFQRPVVLLYSGTEWKEQWTPPNGSIHLLNRVTECTPCFAFQCRYNMECMDIPAEEVTAAALELLGEETRKTEGLLRKESIHDHETTA